MPVARVTLSLSRQAHYCNLDYKKTVSAAASAPAVPPLATVKEGFNDGDARVMSNVVPINRDVMPSGNPMNDAVRVGTLAGRAASRRSTQWAFAEIIEIRKIGKYLRLSLGDSSQHPDSQGQTAEDSCQVLHTS
jgi:hypothetical protein